MSDNDRLKQFQEQIQGVVDLAFFPLSADLQYLTGIPRDIPNFGAVLHPGAWLEGAWLTPNHSPTLLLSRMSSELGGVGASSTVERRVLGDFDDPTALVRDVLKRYNLPANPRVAISDHTSGETIVHLQKILPDAVFHSATDLLRPMRVIKSEAEIVVMRKAGEITEAAFADVIQQIKQGMTELELMTEVDYQLRRHGSLGPSFTTSFYNSGPNYPMVFGQRLQTWKRVLTAPMSILFDFGGVLDGYCYDYGRTVSVGEPDEEMQRVYNLVMQSQAAGVAAMKAGQVTCAQVDAAARQVIVDAGYGEEFRHRLGHSIGLDVHEPPFLTASDHTIIQENMWFTVEPSITQLHNFSARVEDVVIARPGGGEKLTNGYQELIVID